MTNVRAVRRPRRYVSKRWLLLLRPLFGYNFTRDAYVMRGVGLHFGPVLREERRANRQRNRRPWTDRASRLSERRESGDGVERRWARV